MWRLVGLVMDALLLAGGFGTRLRPLTYTRPKPLIPVAGRPMLEWALDRLSPEVDHVVVAVNWLAETLEEYFAQSERDLRFSVVRESEPLGTAGAVKNCQEHLTSDAFFVLNGDIVSDMDLVAMVQQHKETGAVGTISLKEVEPAEVVHYGVVQQDDEDPRRIRGFVEKPATPDLAPSRLINAGAYLLDRSVMDLIQPGRLVSMEKEIFPQLLDTGFYGSSFTGQWIDVGDPARLLQAHRALGGGQNIIGQDCTIAPDAVMQDCILGDGVTVSPGAQLAGCVIGDGETVSGKHRDARVWTQAVPSGYPDKQVGNTLPGAR